MVTAEDRISRGEAPVKAEYIRESEVRVYVPQVHGSNASGTTEQAAVSKRQAKKASCDLEGGGDLTLGSAQSSQRFCWPMFFFFPNVHTDLALITSIGSSKEPLLDG